MTMNITNGDCLKLMKELPDKSVDLFICDLPYGETNCKWDCVIDLDEFWKEFKRLRKSKRTACIHFCSTKFGYTLIKSNEKMFKMDMVWKKRNKTGGLQSRHRPMRNHEMVYFFYEQAPKYNRDKYHKRIQAKPKIEKSETAIFGKEPECKVNFGTGKNFEPPNPLSVIEDKEKKYKFSKDEKCVYGMNKKENTQGTNSFEPPNPASVVEENAESNKVWGYDKPDTFKIDKNGTNQNFKPALPLSVIEEKKYTKEHLDNNRGGAGTNEQSGIFSKENIKKYNKENGVGFTPPNPASVLEEKDEFGWDKSVVKEMGNKIGKVGANFEPPNPASVIEEKTTYGIDKSIAAKSGADISNMKCSFDPPNPASVVEEEDDTVYSKKGWKMGEGFASKDGNKQYLKENPGFTPSQPGSVVEEEFIEPAEDEPKSMFESKKVFIGKRHHQTEKPLDILEFFIKYWSDEGQTILDPTMGSGSTGVACKTLKRNFIGYELNEKIFKVAKNRIEKASVII